MERKHRISTGAIIIQDNKILLVRYADRQGKTYLAAPGGGVNNEEGLSQAAVREVKEETGVEVVPNKILCVEDLYSRRYRMVKVWFLCQMVGGQLEKTQGAIDETIIEAKWYAKEELRNEVVYPQIITESNWESFLKSNWETKYLELSYADF
jgi:ADP-ribose pyrophosphatase YjhB (NUDIX family)